MKFVLYMIMCSGLYSDCMEPHRMPTIYNTHYDCMMAGYDEAIKKQKELGRKESNEYQLLVKFMCSYEKVKQPKVELES